MAQVLSSTLDHRNGHYPFTVLSWVRLHTKIGMLVVTPAFGQKQTSATK